MQLWHPNEDDGGNCLSEDCTKCIGAPSGVKKLRNTNELLLKKDCGLVLSRFEIGSLNFKYVLITILSISI